MTTITPRPDGGTTSGSDRWRGMLAEQTSAICWDNWFYREAVTGVETGVDQVEGGPGDNIAQLDWSKEQHN